MEIVRIVVPALLVYLGLLFISHAVPQGRLSRLRLNQLLFLVATTAAFATTVLAPEVPFRRGLLFIALLTIFEVTASAAIGDRWRWPAVKDRDPVLLYYRGAFVRSAMRRNGVTEERINALSAAQPIDHEQRIVFCIPMARLVLSKPSTYRENPMCSLQAYGKSER
jgi:uncharacterized membrane protein YcaP (DUF421 family)